MKKILTAIAAFLLVIAVVAVFLLNNLDAIVKSLIESVGSETAGTEVRLDSIAIDLRRGSAVIRGFRMANPSGFSERDMFGFAELSISLDLASLNTDMIGISDITARNTFANFERVNGRSNFDVINERLASSRPPAPADRESPHLRIDRLEIENVQASVSDSLLPGSLNLSLGNIVLSDMAGSPEQIAQQVLRPVMAQISRNATAALTTVLMERAGELEGRARDSFNSLQQELAPRLEEALENSRDGLRNLLRRN